jgi:hypothetical protein
MPWLLGIGICFLLQQRDVLREMEVLEAAAGQRCQQVTCVMHVLVVPASFREEIDQHTRPGIWLRANRGGAILNRREMMRLFKAAQAHSKTNLCVAPAISGEVGQTASFCWEPFTWQVALHEAWGDTVHLKASGIITSAWAQIRPDEPQRPTKSLAFQIETRVPDRHFVLFTTRSQATETAEEQDKMMILLVLETRLEDTEAP